QDSHLSCEERRSGFTNSQTGSRFSEPTPRPHQTRVEKEVQRQAPAPGRGRAAFQAEAVSRQHWHAQGQNQQREDRLMTPLSSKFKEQGNSKNSEKTPAAAEVQ